MPEEFVETRRYWWLRVLWIPVLLAIVGVVLTYWLTGGSGQKAASRSGAPVLATVADANTPVEAVAGWGPPRQVFSFEHPSPYPVLDSITNNPEYGDERNFVRVRHASAVPENFADSVTAKLGDSVEFVVLASNDCSDELADSSLSALHGLRVQIAPERVGDSEVISATLTANNAASVSDGAWVDLPPKTQLSYAIGSAKMIASDAAGFPLDDATDFAAGRPMLLGFSQQDGEYPVGVTSGGMERGFGYLEFTMTVVAA